MAHVMAAPEGSSAARAAASRLITCSLWIAISLVGATMRACAGRQSSAMIHALHAQKSLYKACLSRVANLDNNSLGASSGNPNRLHVFPDPNPLHMPPSQLVYLGEVNLKLDTFQADGGKHHSLARARFGLQARAKGSFDLYLSVKCMQ